MLTDKMWKWRKPWKPTAPVFKSREETLINIFMGTLINARVLFFFFKNFFTATRIQNFTGRHVNVGFFELAAAAIRVTAVALEFLLFRI